MSLSTSSSGVAEAASEPEAAASRAAARGRLLVAWRCAAAGLALLAANLFLTVGRGVVDTPGPARLAIWLAVLAGAVAVVGVLRGITGPHFTAPAVLNAVILTLVAPATARASLIADRGNDALQVRQLTAALQHYSANSGSGALPAELGDIFGAVPPSMFRRPGSRQPAPATAAALLEGASDYIYLAAGQSADGKVIPLLCSRPGTLGSWINVGYSDGSVVGRRADSIAAATGIQGLEPPGPPPLPAKSEVFRKSPQAERAEEAEKAAEAERLKAGPDSGQ